MNGQVGNPNSSLVHKRSPKSKSLLDWGSIRSSLSAPFINIGEVNLVLPKVNSGFYCQPLTLFGLIGFQNFLGFGWGWAQEVLGLGQRVWGQGLTIHGLVPFDCNRFYLNQNARSLGVFTLVAGLLGTVSNSLAITVFCKTPKVTFCYINITFNLLQ